MKLFLKSLSVRKSSWNVQAFHISLLKGGLKKKCLNIFLKMGLTQPLFGFYFRSFSQHKDKYSTNFTINDKSIDGVLGSRTRGGMMEGADESTELWLHPICLNILFAF